MCRDLGLHPLHRRLDLRKTVSKKESVCACVCGGGGGGRGTSVFFRNLAQQSPIHAANNKQPQRNPGKPASSSHMATKPHTRTKRQTATTPPKQVSQLPASQQPRTAPRGRVPAGGACAAGRSWRGRARPMRGPSPLCGLAFGRLWMRVGVCVLCVTAGSPRVASSTINQIHTHRIPTFCPKIQSTKDTPTHTRPQPNASLA